MVNRWYGGVHLQNRRWQIINECALESLRKGKFVPDIAKSKSALPKSSPCMRSNESLEIISPSTVLLCDSTSADTNINSMIPGKGRGKKLTSATLDSTISNLKKLGSGYCVIIIQSGVNYHMSSSEEVVKQKLINVLDTAKQCHPRADMFMCILLPDKFDPSDTIHINNYNRTQGSRKQCHVVETEEVFKWKSNLYKNRKHPNYRGTAQIVMSIKSKHGLSTALPSQYTQNTGII